MHSNIDVFDGVKKPSFSVALSEQNLKDYISSRNSKGESTKNINQTIIVAKLCHYIKVAWQGNSIDLLEVIKHIAKHYEESGCISRITYFELLNIINCLIEEK